ncbi:MAG TPA: peptidoglycan bridge formation glycyltransferase FemA/FemB family protein [Candidatus Limnocylindrales bacterium]
MTTPVEASGLPTSDEAWDAFVAADPLGSYLQTSPWGRIKRANGWRPRRVVAGTAGGPIGAQLLVRHSGPLPWSFAYAPRGPVAAAWTPDAVAALGDALRQAARRGHRLSHVRIEPPVERDGPLDPYGSLRQALVANGWRPAPPIQPAASRIIDLTADEAALWGDLRSKWRQYVNRARRASIRVVDAEGDRLPEFYAIYRQTAARTGLLIRTEESYRAVWDAFRPLGMARLLFAEDEEGAAQAALFLLRCGDRVVEPYGGMTAAGASSRANYLLKWEAIRLSREAGATSYDLWGLVHAGIDQFKAGFGGREVHYVGAWDLVVDPLGHLATELGVRARAVYVRQVRARRLRGADDGDGAGRQGAASPPEGEP